MKVCLVRAPLTLSKYASASPAVPPIGLAYVAAQLVQDGHDVSVVDSIGEAIDEYIPFRDDTVYRGLTLEQIVERSPAADVFGVSVMFSQDWPLTRILIQKLKERHPHSLIVCGGEHATAESKGSMEGCPELDFIVSGEGEYTMSELLLTLDQKGDLSKVSGIHYRNSSGEVLHTPKRARVKSLDEIPWPAWDLFPLENYLSAGHGWGVNRGRSMPMVASRGCPYQCTFCSNPQMWTPRWVVRSVDDVIAEIKFYIEKYQAKNIDFQDLTAIIKKEWIISFCQRLIEENIVITWQLPTGTRSEAIDEEVAPYLYASGCRNMTYAPESGDLEVLKRIKKKVHLEAILKSTRAAVRAGINVKYNFIFGFPEDTYANIPSTLWFMWRIALVGVSDISIAPFSPYPGSELFFKLQREGKIPAKLDDAYYMSIPFSDMSKTVSWCESFSPKALNRLRNVAMMSFYLVSWLTHPLRPFRVLANLLTGREESRMDKALADMKRRMRLLSSKKESLNPGSVSPF